jgi:two-component system chemotaxis response regulator CheB
MAQHDIVVIGASAGGLQALSTILERLPPSLPARVLIVVHGSPTATGVLPDVLDRSCPLPVAFASDGDGLTSGRVYIARPDFHLLVASGRVALTHGPREHGFRPAIDPLFRTAARELGPRVIGVVLSGALSDGTYGLSVIKHYGGVAIVQDPGDAIISGMPTSALNNVDVDHILRAADIAAAIERLTGRDAGSDGEPAMPCSKGPEPQSATEETEETTEVAEMKGLFGPPTGLTCPDCGGALWGAREERTLRYQCHVGHQYAPENLDAGQRDAIDGALWSAVRVLEGHAELKMRLSRRAEGARLMAAAEGFAEGARDAHEHAEQLRSLLFSMGNGVQKKSVAAQMARPTARGRAGEPGFEAKNRVRQRRARRKA